MQSFLVLYASRIGLLGIAFLADVIITRQLGPALRGEYFLFVTIAAQVSLLATLGLEYSFPNRAREGLLKTYVTAEMKLRLFQSLIVILTASLAMFFIFGGKFVSIESKSILLIVVILICLLEVLFVWTTYYRLALGEVIATTKIRYVRRLIFLMVIAVMAYLKVLSLEYAIAAYGISSLSILYYFQKISTTPVIRNETSTQPLQFHLVLIKALQFFLIRGNVYLASYLLLPKDIGYLSIAMAVLELMLFLPNSLINALFSKMHYSDMDYINTRRQLLAYTTALLIAQSLVVYFFAGTFVHFIYGDAFLPSVQFIQAYALVHVVIAPVIVVIANALRYNDLRQITYSLISASLTFLFVGAWLTIEEGIIGGIAAQFIACLVFITLYFCYGRFREGK